MKIVLSVDPLLGGREMEPTLGAGDHICLEELLSGLEEALSLIYGFMEAREYTRARLAFHETPETSIYAVIYWDEPCIRLENLRARFCGGSFRSEVLEWPEVSRAALEGGCVEIVIPGDNSIRVKNALSKLGVDVRVLREQPRLEPLE